MHLVLIKEKEERLLVLIRQIVSYRGEMVLKLIKDSVQVWEDKEMLIVLLKEEEEEESQLVLKRNISFKFRTAKKKERNLMFHPLIYQQKKKHFFTTTVSNSLETTVSHVLYPRTKTAWHIFPHLPSSCWDRNQIYFNFLEMVLIHNPIFVV